MNSSTTDRVQVLLAELQRGIPSAEDRLLEVVHHRFRILAHRMLRHYIGFRHVEDTDDVLQRTWLRLHSALKSFRPESPHVFFAIASKHMRWVLIDMASLYKQEKQDRVDLNPEQLSVRQHSLEPLSLEDWAHFHASVERLSDEEKEVVSLLYYQGLTQDEASVLIGVSLRTVKLRWQSAKLKMSRMVKE